MLLLFHYRHRSPIHCHSNGKRLNGLTLWLDYYLFYKYISEVLQPFFFLIIMFAVSCKTAHTSKHTECDTVIDCHKEVEVFSEDISCAILSHGTHVWFHIFCLVHDLCLVFISGKLDNGYCVYIVLFVYISEL